MELGLLRLQSIQFLNQVDTLYIEYASARSYSDKYFKSRFLTLRAAMTRDASENQGDPQVFEI